MSIACALASGPVSAWPTILPLLIDEEVFAGEHQKASFDAVYGLSMVMMLAVGLPAGLAFDELGGRTCGIAGAAMATLGLAGMAASTAGAAQGLSPLLYLAYPLAMAGGTINTYSLYSFLWFLPEHQVVGGGGRQRATRNSPRPTTPCSHSSPG